MYFYYIFTLVRGTDGDMCFKVEIFLCLFFYCLMRFQVYFNNWGFPDESLK